MIALFDNPSIPRSGADDYCPENMSKKLLRSLYLIKVLPLLFYNSTFASSLARLR